MNIRFHEIYINMEIPHYVFKGRPESYNAAPFKMIPQSLLNKGRYFNIFPFFFHSAAFMINVSNCENLIYRVFAYENLYLKIFYQQIFKNSITKLSAQDCQLKREIDLKYILHLIPKQKVLNIFETCRFISLLWLILPPPPQKCSYTHQDSYSFTLSQFHTYQFDYIWRGNFITMHKQNTKKYNTFHILMPSNGKMR